MSKSYEHKDLLNRLSEMQRAPYYATACHDLVKAEMAIVALENEREALQARCAELEAEATHKALVIATWRDRHDTLAAELAELRKQEPVCYIAPFVAVHLKSGPTQACLYKAPSDAALIPLFAAPVPPVREPLSDEQIDAVRSYPFFKDSPQTQQHYRNFARAIEAAIREQK